MNYYEYYLMYFKYLYEQGVISRDVYLKIKEEILEQMNNGSSQKPDDDKEKRYVSIKSMWNDKYVSVKGERDFLEADSNRVGASERFELIELKNDKVILQADSGYYVRLKDDFLVADETDRKKAEKFKIEYKGDDVTLKSSNGYYVRVRERDSRLVARAEKQGPKTRFEIEDIKKIDVEDVVIKSISEQRFVRALNGSGSALVADAFDENRDTRFDIEELKNEKIAIKTKDGYYVRVRDDNDILWADARRLKDATKFKVIELDNDEIALKAPNGYYVRVRDKDKWLVAKADKTGKKARFQIYM